jgi:hypothetical protein
MTHGWQVCLQKTLQQSILIPMVNQIMFPDNLFQGQLVQAASDNLQPSKPPLSEMPRTKQQVYLEMLPQRNTYVTSQQAN